MPSSFIQKHVEHYANKNSMTIPKALNVMENLWNRACNISGEKFRPYEQQYYPYAMSVFKQMTGLDHIQLDMEQLETVSRVQPTKRKGFVPGRKEQRPEDKPGKHNVLDKPGRGSVPKVAHDESMVGGKLPKWWKELGVNERKTYLEQHPNSKLKDYIETDLADKPKEQVNVPVEKPEAKEQIEELSPEQQMAQKLTEAEEQIPVQEVDRELNEKRDEINQAVSDGLTDQEKEQAISASDKLEQGEELDEEETKALKKTGSIALLALYVGLVGVGYMTGIGALLHPASEKMFEEYERVQKKRKKRADRIKRIEEKLRETKVEQAKLMVSPMQKAKTTIQDVTNKILNLHIKLRRAKGDTDGNQ